VTKYEAFCEYVLNEIAEGATRVYTSIAQIVLWEKGHDTQSGLRREALLFKAEFPQHARTLRTRRPVTNRKPNTRAQTLRLLREAVLWVRSHPYEFAAITSRFARASRPLSMRVVMIELGVGAKSGLHAGIGHIMVKRNPHLADRIRFRKRALQEVA
jgi:hypothetical protein